MMPPIVAALGRQCPRTAPAPSSQTAMGALAASMSAGSWAQLTVSTQNSVLGVGPTSGSVLHYCNSMPWDPIAKSIVIIANDHDYPTTLTAHCRYQYYDDATNTFILNGDPPSGVAAGVQHGYDHNTLNPTTGDHYYRNYNSAIFCVKPTGGASFSNIAAYNDHGFTQADIGSCWWSGTFTGAGAQGCLLAANPYYQSGGNQGQIVGYNPLNTTWFFEVLNAMVGTDPTNGPRGNVIEYSPIKNVAVYGGGVGAESLVWRLNSDGTFTSLTGVPSGKGLGIQQGNLACDPVTGNFLLLSKGELWELNPAGSGTWTQQTGSRVPPANYDPFDDGSPNGVISCSIAVYGVIAYVQQTSSGGGTFYLYKHA